MPNGTMRSMSLGPRVAKSTYSVKYLGIVDGAMGILSRKMAMQGTFKETATGAHDKVRVNHKIISEQNNRRVTK
jgi:hypothetical protein